MHRKCPGHRPDKDLKQEGGDREGRTDTRTDRGRGGLGGRGGQLRKGPTTPPPGHRAAADRKTQQRVYEIQSVRVRAARLSRRVSPRPDRQPRPQGTAPERPPTPTRLCILKSLFPTRCGTHGLAGPGRLLCTPGGGSVQADACLSRLREDSKERTNKNKTNGPWGGRGHADCPAACVAGRARVSGSAVDRVGRGGAG